MTSANFRYVAAGIAMVLTAALALALTPSRVAPHERPDFERVVPVQFGDWRVDPHVPVISPDVQVNLRKIYDETVARTYVDVSGQRVMLVVAYASEQTHSSSQKVHRQEGCYTSQGFRIEGLTHDNIRIGQRQLPAVRFVATRGQRVEPVTYWFRTGKWVLHTHFGRFMLFLQGITGEIPDGMLVRVSVLSRDTSRSFALQDDFVRELLRNMAPQDTRRLVGSL